MAALPDYDEDSNLNDISMADNEDVPTGDPIENDLQDNAGLSSPDEGFDSYPPSSSAQGSTPEANIGSENNIAESSMRDSVPPSTDEGILLSPTDTPNDAPISDTPNDVEMADTPGMSEISKLEKSFPFTL